MAMKLKQPQRETKPVVRRVPWWTDVTSARQEALCSANSCVIILNADSAAL
jgi:hypothetical protein